MLPLLPRDIAAPIQHGGDLGAARTLFPGAPEPFIDLSTGINPFPYPLPPLDPAERNVADQRRDPFHGLGERGAEHGLLRGISAQLEDFGAERPQARLDVHPHRLRLAWSEGDAEFGCAPRVDRHLPPSAGERLRGSGDGESGHTLLPGAWMSRASNPGA